MSLEDWKEIIDFYGNHLSSDTHVIFEISKHLNLVKLNFKHTYWKEQTEFFATCNYHWGRHLTMLKNYCETSINQLDQKVESEEIKKVKG